MTKTKGEQTAQMALEAALSHLLAVLGGPGIIVVGKDSRFSVEFFQDSRTARNIALQPAIPGHHQSSGPQGVGADISELSLSI